MNFNHGHNRKGARTPTYRAWAAAKNRCTNQRNDERALAPPRKKVTPHDEKYND